MLNVYVCVMYVVLYVMKTEKAMGTLLKQVTAEFRTDELKVQFKKLGSAFLNHREVSALVSVGYSSLPYGSDICAISAFRENGFDNVL